MHKRTVGQRERVMAVLWSEFFALWFDRARRRALPLLLATLLLLIPSLPALADCSCDMSGQHVHEMTCCPDGDADAHDPCEAHEHSPHQGFVESPTAHRTGHVHLLAALTASVKPTGMACSCSPAPVGAAIVAVAATPGFHADSHLVWVNANASPLFRFDALTGLFGRAGPEPNSKPSSLFLSSLAGRAPPVSL